MSVIVASAGLLAGGAAYAQSDSYQPAPAPPPVPAAQAPAAPDASAPAPAAASEPGRMQLAQAATYQFGDPAQWKAGDPGIVSNGPVPDTPQNRAQYGAPDSHAGQRTQPAGN
jgi:hypothetical protein